MQPLMSQEMYERFSELRSQLLRYSDKISNIFVPVGGESDTSPKILFLGRATRGWAEEEASTFGGSLKQSQSGAQDFLQRQRSPFWQFIRSVLRGIQEPEAPDLSVHEMLSQMAWSNIVKIGVTTRNPLGFVLEKQARLCIEQLHFELETYKPDATIVLTTNYGEVEITEPLFGTGWRFDNEHKDSIAHKKDKQFGTVIWTNHPQRMGPRGYRPRITATTIDFVLRTLQGLDLPPSAIPP